MPPFSVIMLGRARASTVKRPDICACVCASGGWLLGPSVERADIVLFWEVSQALSALGFATAPTKRDMFKKVLNVQDIHGLISFLFTQGL